MCDCIKTTNELLAKEHNGELVVTLFGNPQRTSIEVQKLDSKKRVKPPRLIASYCPFCGEKYVKESA